MRISTRLKLAAWLPLVMGLVVTLALVGSYRAQRQAQQRSWAVQRIINGTNELNTLARSYMLYQEDRPRIQFLAEHEAVARLITEFRPSGRDQQRLLKDIVRNSESLRGLFLKLVDNAQRQGPSEDPVLHR